MSHQCRDLPSAISLNILMHQLKIIHSKNAVSNKSSTVHAKKLGAVQLSLQLLDQLTWMPKADRHSVTLSVASPSKDPVVQQ